MGHPSNPLATNYILFLSHTLGLGLPLYLPQYSIQASIPLTFLAIFVPLFALRLIYTSQIWPWLLSPLRDVPGPRNASWLNGQFWVFKGIDPFPILKKWAEEIPNDGLIKWHTLLNREFLMPTSPEILRQILVTECYNFPKPEHSRQFIRRLIGDGLVSIEGNEHKAQRKSLMPAFQYRHVKDLVPTFWSRSRLMVRIFGEQHAEDLSKDGAVVNFTDWVARCTLDIIGTTGMGVEFNAMNDPKSHLNSQYKRMFKPNWQDMVIEVAHTFFPEFVIRLIPLPRNGEIQAAVQTVRNVSRDIIKQKKQQMLKSDAAASTKDILSVALASGEFEDERLVDHTMTFLAAGHETTSSAVQWALVALAQNPEIQTRLRDEIRRVLPSPKDENAVVTADLIDSCEYLHAVCSETLRFYPSVPATSREASQDTMLNGIVVKKGTLVIMSAALINCSTALWGADADKFDPQRWMGSGANASSGGATSNFANLTFLHGPRSCIGQAFAKWEFACLLAAIVGSFEFALEMKLKDGVVESEHHLTSRPKGGLTLRMKKVEGW